ncbi:ribokinase, partial [bacterium]
VDTTAAGDAFNGALAAFLAQGREMENAILLANCVGALTCTKHGAQDAMPTLADLREAVGELL